MQYPHKRMYEKHLVLIKGNRVIQKCNAHINLRPKPPCLKWFGVPKTNTYFCAKLTCGYCVKVIVLSSVIFALGFDENDPILVHIF
jgi:hypothetical protein